MRLLNTSQPQKEEGEPAANGLPLRTHASGLCGFLTTVVRGLQEQFQSSFSMALIRQLDSCPKDPGQAIGIFYSSLC